MAFQEIGYFQISRVLQPLSMLRFACLAITPVLVPMRVYFVVRMPLRAMGNRLLPLTALFDHINGIGFFRPKKQMVGINAGAVIAFVENTIPFWNFSVMQLPRNTIGSDVMHTNPQLPLAIGFDRANPRPTLIFSTLINFMPKSVGDGIFTGAVIWL